MDVLMSYFDIKFITVFPFVNWIEYYWSTIINLRSIMECTMNKYLEWREYIMEEVT